MASGFRDAPAEEQAAGGIEKHGVPGCFGAEALGFNAVNVRQNRYSRDCGRASSEIRVIPTVVGIVRL